MADPLTGTMIQDPLEAKRGDTVRRFQRKRRVARRDATHGACAVKQAPGFLLPLFSRVETSLLHFPRQTSPHQGVDETLPG